jgi:CheY-like chemotaxis protein
MAYRNILLIDDDDDDQEIFLEAVLEISAEVKCTALCDASEALRKLADGELQPDVIFLDLNMPVMDGQQFLTEIKQRSGLQHIPVIIFSTSSHTATIIQTKALGASDFITKPGAYNDLVNILTPLLG